MLRMTETGGRSPQGTVERTVARTTRTVREWQPGGPVAGRRRFGVVPHVLPRHHRGVVTGDPSQGRSKGRLNDGFRRRCSRLFRIATTARTRPRSIRLRGQQPRMRRSQDRPPSFQTLSVGTPSTIRAVCERCESISVHRGRLFRCQGFVAGCLGTELR